MAIEAAQQAITIPWDKVLSLAISPFFALVGALAGAFLANHFAEKRFNKQIEYEINKEKFKTAREKGEELLLTLSKWGKQLYFVQMGRLSTLSGNRTVEQMNELHKEVTDPYTHVEAHVLLGVYFPQFSDDLDEIFKMIDLTNNIFESFMAESANKQAGVRTLGLQATKAEQALDVLIDSIRKHIVDKYTQ